MNSPLRWHLWGAFFFDIFQKYIFISPNIWSCTAFLFWQSCNCGTIAYTQHEPDFVSCMWGSVKPGSHILCLQCECSPCVVRKWCRSSTDCAFTQKSATDPLLFITNTTFIHYWFQFQIQTLFLKILFQHCDTFFFTQYSNTIFHRCLNAINIRNILFNAFYFCIYF